MIAKVVDYALKRFEDAKAKRSPFDGDWNSIRDFIRPISVIFNQQTGQYVTVRPETMFDGTAADALEELAAALHSYLSSPSERWFELQIEGVPREKLSSEELMWLDEAADVIYAYYQREDSNINGAFSEVYLDLGSYGTAVMAQEWDRDINGLIFSAKPLPHAYILENSKGRVDTIFFVRSWTIRQVKQEFGYLPPELQKIDNEDRQVEVLHAVFPRTDKLTGASPTRMPFASMWICLSTKELLLESGYETFPYSVPRWTKLSGEFYGRGPARRCLPDIKMLNQMERTILKAGQKMVDPPLILSNEGWLLPIRTSPGGLIFKEDEERTIEPLKIEGNLPWGEEKAEQKRDFIRRCFFNDWIRREKKKREQSAHEIMDDRDEMLRLFAPIFGRITTEMHGPLVTRSYHILNSKGKIPQAPESLSGRRLAVGYTSAASRAQLLAKAGTISQFIQDLIPLAQVSADILDAVDMDAVAQQLAIARGAPRAIMRSPEDLAKLREQKNQMNQMAQMAQIAEPASKAIANISKAQQMQ